MDYCFIYHIFSERKIKIIDSERCPIIFSILTLKNFYPNIPIHILDMTPENHIWEDFPKKLNLNIHSNLRNINNLNIFAKKIIHINDFLKFASSKIFYSDCDIFWKEIPVFSDFKKFTTSYQEKNGLIRSNSGFYYFEKETDGHELFKKWVFNIDNIHNKKLNINEFLKKSNLKEPTDESILSYTIQNNKILTNNYDEIGLIGKNFNYKNCKGYHILSSFTDKKKNFLISINDFIDIINKNIKKYNLNIDILNKQNKTLESIFKKKKIKLI